MPHEDFFEAKLIEFSTWDSGKEKTIKQYEKFESYHDHHANAIENTVKDMHLGVLFVEIIACMNLLADH